MFSERLEWTDQSFFFSCYALALIVGVILGRLRLPHQPHPSPRAGTHDHWKVLPSSLHCILHCERVLLQRAVFRDMFLHVFLAYFSSGLLPWDYTFNANILCRLPAHVLQRTHGGEREREKEEVRERGRGRKRKREGERGRERERDEERGRKEERKRER